MTPAPPLPPRRVPPGPVNAPPLAGAADAKVPRAPAALVGAAPPAPFAVNVPVTSTLGASRNTTPPPPPPPPPSPLGAVVPGPEIPPSPGAPIAPATVIDVIETSAIA